jgi:4-hydroxy 2-oxovalerate aldolase
MKILDCTLRDGGYYTNWDFPKDVFYKYIESMNDLPIEYIEVGYRNLQQDDYFGEFFYCPIYKIKQWRRLTTKKIALMLNSKDLNIEDIEGLLAPCIGYVDMIRLAVAPNIIADTILKAKEIKKMGFEIAFNIMYMSDWNANPNIYKEFNQLDGVVDYLYMVDSYGAVYPEDIPVIIKKVKEQTNVALGFHGHNNLELAIINTLTAISSGVDIVDSTITGMGRGAGNLKTELLLTVLNSKSSLAVDFNALSFIVGEFENLKQKYNWGTILPYMVSGANSFPQKDVMEWVTKRFYSINSIIRALENKKNDVKDNETFEVFKRQNKFKKAIIIGGGPNGSMFAEEVAHLINDNADVCLIHASAKNAIYYQNINVKQYFCLVGNEGHRLEKVLKTLTNFNGDCVLPPYPRKMGTYVPSKLRSNCYELQEISFTNLVRDSHTVLALQTALDLGVSELGLIGYDGYLDGLISNTEKGLSEENNELFKDFNEQTDVKTYSLSQTNYNNLPVVSIFSILK